MFANAKRDAVSHQFTSSKLRRLRDAANAEGRKNAKVRTRTVYFDIHDLKALAPSHEAVTGIHVPLDMYKWLAKKYSSDTTFPRKTRGKYVYWEMRHKHFCAYLKDVNSLSKARVDHVLVKVFPRQLLALVEQHGRCGSKHYRNNIPICAKTLESLNDDAHHRIQNNLKDKDIRALSMVLKNARTLFGIEKPCHLLINGNEVFYGDGKWVDFSEFKKSFQTSCNLKLTFIKSVSLSNREARKNIVSWLQHFENMPIEEITIPSVKFEQLPQGLDKLNQLKILNLDTNKLKNIDSLSTLKALETLILHTNQIEAIPTSLGQLKKLKILSLAGNLIPNIPNELGNLSQLEELYLSSNKITTIPPDSLGRLKKLKELYLDNNEINNIPDDLGNLSQLEILDLTDNQIIDIPRHLGNLSQLKELHLESNKITTIMPDSLGRLKNLKVLDLRTNQIQNIPDDLGNLSQLEVLHLQNSGIKNIPDELGNLLSQLTLGGPA